MANPGFAVFSESADPAVVTALRDQLRANSAEIELEAVNTLEAAIDSSADVLILFMDDSQPQERIAELVERLKAKKVIGIGYGAAQLFGMLGLEIRGDACAHYGSTAPKIRVQENNLISASRFTDAVFPVQLSPQEFMLDHFGMHIPRHSQMVSVVDVIARSDFEESYAPIVRQGNYVMIGLVAPPTLWTPKYGELFQSIAVALRERKTEPFSRAQWEVTKPGLHDFKLVEFESTQAAYAQKFYFRFSKPTAFSATLTQSGSEDVMLLFMGERDRLHWTREDARSGDVLNIKVDITEEDLRNIGDFYWTLDVTNFDSAHPAQCSLRIEYEE
jgi:hypothetical protein